MLSTIYLNEFFDELGFATEVHYINLDVKSQEKIYTINGESVFVEFKNEVRPQNIFLFEKNRSANYPILVASKYITPKAKETLKSKGINYIDSYGNAFLNLTKLKVYVEKGDAKPVYGKNSNKAFTKSGGQVIYQLLQNQEAINLNHRDLAKLSKVSLGTVSNVINALFDSGYLVHWNNEKKYQLIKKDILLEKWVTIVNEKILPAFKIGSFRMSESNNEDWRNLTLDRETFWSGEPAASELTKYLEPESFSMFTTKSKIDITKYYKFLPDQSGTITVYKPFWQIDDLNSIYGLNYDWNDNLSLNLRTVHPILIYAELIYSGRERNIETAKIIFDEYIKPNL